MSGRSRGLLRSALRRAAMLGSGAALAVSAGPATGQSLAVSGTTSTAPALAWSGPGPELTCLGEAGLARAVNEYLGREAFASASVELVLQVKVERLADRSWRAVLTLSDRSGQVLGKRELESGGDLCSSLDEPLVLAVALMVDSEPVPPPPPVTKPEPEPEPEPPPADAPEPPPPAPRGAEAHRLHLDASVALEVGLLPAARPGVAVGFELDAAPWLSTRLSAVGFIPASAEVAAGASVQFALVAGKLELCPGLGDPDGLRVALCVGALYGAWHASSTGLTGGQSTWEALFGASLGARARVPLGGAWSGVAEATGIVPYRPDHFVYEAQGVPRELFSVATLALLATVGASVTF